MLYGATSHGPKKSSYAASTVNVAISRAVDLFILVVDRDCYGYNAQEVFFGSDAAKSYGFRGSTELRVHPASCIRGGAMAPS